MLRKSLLRIDMGGLGMTHQDVLRIDIGGLLRIGTECLGMMRHVFSNCIYGRLGHDSPWLTKDWRLWHYSSKIAKDRYGRLGHDLLWLSKEFTVANFGRAEITELY